MKKPVIYAQYDKVKLYDSHYYRKGDFSFEKKGFGPVALTIRELEDYIVNALISGCKMPVKYQRRVDRMFKNVDGKNAQRVYEALIGIN